MMNLRVELHQAYRYLMHGKLRAFLAILGIVIGTASVVAMISISLLATQQILNQYQKMGVTLISASLYDLSGNQANNPETELTLEKLTQLQNQPSLMKSIELIAPYTSQYQVLIHVDASTEGSVMGVTPALFRLAGLEVASGRWLTFLDAHHQHAVIGSGLLKPLDLGTPQEAIGQWVRVGSTYYQIMGVLKPWPSNFFFDGDFNQSLLIPIQSALNQSNSVAITELAVKVNHTGDISKTTKALHAWLSKHTSHVQIYLQSPESLIKSMQASSATMTRLLGFIGAISLIVGGIGIMNMMLISVMERQKEIGLRMAVGATRRRIQCQFLVEACVLSLIGGGVGTLLGLLITEGVALYSHWTQTFFLFPPLLGLGMSLVMGIGFGWYPAWKAAQLDPIQTLRAD